jgi:hypothetical protein
VPQSVEALRYRLEIFIDIVTSVYTMALVSTEPVTELSSSNICWCVNAAVV